MKKTGYITLHVLLGIMVNFIIHAAIEIPAIALLVSDDGLWISSFSPEAWIILHNVVSALLLVLGIYFGYRLGKRNWQKMYNKKS